MPKLCRFAGEEEKLQGVVPQNYVLVPRSREDNPGKGFRCCREKVRNLAHHCKVSGEPHNTAHLIYRACQPQIAKYHLIILEVLKVSEPFAL